MPDDLQEYLTESREALLRADSEESFAAALAALTEARMLAVLANG
jgi:hypothetical protein